MKTHGANDVGWDGNVHEECRWHPLQTKTTVLEKLLPPVPCNINIQLKNLS